MVRYEEEGKKKEEEERKKKDVLNVMSIAELLFVGSRARLAGLVER